MVTILFKKLSDAATLPSRGSDFAAGYDLYSTEDYVLMPMQRKLFKTGISMAISSGLYGRIAPRSGLAYKNGIDVMAGVIDEDYRGDVGVILINLGTTEFKVSKGDKIAQIIFENYNTVELVETTSELPISQRGDGGFGSTDVKLPITGGLVRPTFPPNTLVKEASFNSDEQITWVSNDVKPVVISDEGDLIRIRSSAPKIVEDVEPNERKFTEDKPYHQTGKSSILEKWKEQHQPENKVGYETMVREREKSE